jgi:2-phosphoglycerate kinase
VPGFVDLEPWQDRTLAVPVVISVDDEDLHRGHFVVRGRETPTRPVDRYQKGFANIRKVQKYIKSQALSHGVPVIPNYSLDQAIGAVIDLVIERMTGRAEGAESAERPKVARLER